ncbi:MAG: hypothetical protein WBQ50_07010 [Nocardioides sp.]
MRVSRVIAVGLSSALVAVAPALTIPPVQAQAKCVSKAEYKAIHKGQSRAKVHRIVQHQAGGGGSSETYSTCGWTMHGLAISWIYVEYTRGKVSGKSAFSGSVS